METVTLCKNVRAIEHLLIEVLQLTLCDLDFKDLQDQKSSRNRGHI